MVFKGTLIFSRTNFAPAYIKSFNSVMSFVRIFVNKSLTFSVSDLTVLQSWFLREGNVVFFSDMILLMASTLVFPLGSVFAFLCSRCMSHCHVVFGDGIKGLLMCLPIHLLVDFQYFKVRKQPFFVIVLTWSTSLWFVALNLPNSVQFSIILFLYPLFAGLLLK